MPTTSQIQILQRVLGPASSSGCVDNEINIKTKLKDIEIPEGNEDQFGLEKLKTKITELQDKTESSSGQSGQPTSAAIPSLPSKVRSSLYKLGFRNAKAKNKKTLSRLIQSERNKGTEDIPRNSTDFHSDYKHTKASIQRKVRKPDPKPNACCFNYPGPDLTHLEVKRAMDKLLVLVPEVKMETIEFQPRCKLLRPNKLENTCRWVITLNTECAVPKVTNKQFIIEGKAVLLKSYNEVVDLEYKYHGQMTDLLKIVYNL